MFLSIKKKKKDEKELQQIAEGLQGPLLAGRRNKGDVGRVRGRSGRLKICLFCFVFCQSQVNGGSPRFRRGENEPSLSTRRINDTPSYCSTDRFRYERDEKKVNASRIAARHSNGQVAQKATCCRSRDPNRSETYIVPLGVEKNTWNTEQQS